MRTMRGAGMADTLPNATSTQTIQQAHPRVLTGRKDPYLVVVKGNGAGRHFALTGSTFRIGRAPDMEIALNDELASRCHCAVTRRDGVVILEDCDSKNGTFVDGRRIAREAITPVSSIQVGHTLLKLEYKELSEVEFEEELFRNATTDALTNAANRFYFMRRAEEELALARRGAYRVAIVMIDLDSFKDINDALGHQAGDFVLRAVASAIDAVKRREDILGRYGGDEFICMLRGQGGEPEIRGFCERIRARIETEPVVFDAMPIRATVSIGAAVSPRSGEIAIEDLIAAADRALYAAKQDGRNRIRIGAAGEPKA
jgi:two-component system, cell cycle response regulator